MFYPHFKIGSQNFNLLIAFSHYCYQLIMYFIYNDHVPEDYFVSRNNKLSVYD